MFFQKLYDETPTHHVYEDGHYSVYRAVIYVGRSYCHHTFAVLWDADHDERILELIAEVMRRGFLHNYVLFGEHKGHVTAFMKPETVDWPDPPNTLLESIAQDMPDDAWSATEYCLSQSLGLTWARDRGIDAYLRNIEERWPLGFKVIAPWRSLL